MTTATPTDGADVLGVPAGDVVRPGSTEQVADAVRGAGTVLPAGGRSKLGWAPPPERVDLLVDTTGLDAVVEHVAGDLVVVAEAGVRLADLQARLAEAGQWLALDPPEEGATLGGVVSANASGPRRLRYGTTRDLLIGCTLVLADGTVARSGGKVVKNVAGYDLGKLLAGAHGTLGVVTSTTWRLHPLPPARRVVVRRLDAAADAAPLVQALVRSTLTPTALELLDDAAGPRLVALFESIEASVEAQAATAVELLGGGEVGDALPDGFGARPVGDLVLRLAFAPSALAPVLSALPAGSRVAAHAGTGVAYAALDDPSALAPLRAALAPHDGTAVVLSAAPALRAGLDHWGPVGDALELMRRVKHRFDPERRMAPGRFVGGI